MQLGIGLLLQLGYETRCLNWITRSCVDVLVTMFLTAHFTSFNPVSLKGRSISTNMVEFVYTAIIVLSSKLLFERNQYELKRSK